MSNPDDSVDKLETFLRFREQIASQLENLELKPSNELHVDEVSETFDDKIKELDLEKKKKDIQHKDKTLNMLLKFLVYETIAVFVLALLQGFSWTSFDLDDMTFRILTSVTILQISAMLTIAVKHLFPSHV